MRGRLPELSAEGIDVLLLDIHAAPGAALLERFDFEMTPTYIAYDASGTEALRSTRLPDTVTLGDLR